jgi:hypothetical protein
MLKVMKKQNLEEKFNLDILEPNKLSTYRDLYRKYKREGNDAKAKEYEELIAQLTKNNENKVN